MSSRSPKRVLRIFFVLVLCLGLFSWCFSHYFTKSSSSTLLSKEKQHPEYLELSNASHASQNSTWAKDAWIQQRQKDTSIHQVVPELSFIQQLQIYETQGHNLSALLRLPAASSSKLGSITAIIHATTEQSMQSQLDALENQTLGIHTIWVICSKALQPTAESMATKHRSSNNTILVMNTHDMNTTTTIHRYPYGSAGAAPWLPLLRQVQTDYVWILEDGVTPNSKYLETIYGMLQTDNYQGALLGTHATLLPSNFNTVHTNKKMALSQLHCLPTAFQFLPKLTQPVDMIHHTWLLRASWIPHLLMDRRINALESPLSYYISQSLLSYAGVPSIVIPPTTSSDSPLTLQNIRPDDSCDKSIPASFQHSEPWNRILALQSNPTALDQRHQSLITSYGASNVLFYIDGPNEAKAFLSLICGFVSSLDSGGVSSLHVAVTGKQRGLSGALLSTLIERTTECQANPVIHDLDLYTAMSPSDTAALSAQLLARLVQALQPRVLFHIKQDSPMFHSVDLLAKSYHISTIQLPINDVRHALWISKLPLEALEYWNQVKIDLVVITDRRPHSLSRLLNSIGHGKYLGDKVDLTIHMEQSADRVTRMFVNNLYWQHGAKKLRHRIQKGGLMPAIIESWYPSDNNNYGVILEDDIEVSPLFYAWAKYNILHYRYSLSNAEAYPWMYGVSLYSPRNLELMPEGRKSFDPNDVLLPNDFPPRTPYASQVPCSWGAVYFPEHWREFHQYLTNRLLDLQAKKPRLNIFVPNSRSERWKKSWKKYFIEMVYLRAYVMVYPNFQDFESFSTNHLEFGTHIKHDRAQTALDSFVVPLMQRDTLISQLPEHQLPNFEHLPMMDLWGTLMTHEQMDTIAADWHQEVSACPRQQPNERFNPYDLLCPFPANSTHRPNINQADASNKTPAPSKPTTKKKQVKVVKTKHMLEHIEYVTVYVDEQNGDHNSMTDIDMGAWDEMPEPLDVATMTTSTSDHQHEDDETKDLEANWETLRNIAI